MECEDFGAASIPSALTEMVAAATAFPDMFSAAAAAVVAEAAEVLEVGVCLLNAHVACRFRRCRPGHAA